MTPQAETRTYLIYENSGSPLQRLRPRAAPRFAASIRSQPCWPRPTSENTFQPGECCRCPDAPYCPRFGFGVRLPSPSKDHSQTPEDYGRQFRCMQAKGPEQPPRATRTSLMRLAELGVLTNSSRELRPRTDGAVPPRKQPLRPE